MRFPCLVFGARTTGPGPRPRLRGGRHLTIGPPSVQRVTEWVRRRRRARTARGRWGHRAWACHGRTSVTAPRGRRPTGGPAGGRCGDLPAGWRAHSVGHLDRIEAVRSTVPSRPNRRPPHRSPRRRSAPARDRAHHLGGPQVASSRPSPVITRSAPARTSSSPTRSAATSTPRATDVAGSAQRGPNPSPPAAPLPGSSRCRSRARSRSATSAQAPRAAVRSSTSSGVRPSAARRPARRRPARAGRPRAARPRCWSSPPPTPTTRPRCGAGPRCRP